MIIEKLNFEFEFDDKVINSAKMNEMYYDMCEEAEKTFRDNFNKKFKDIASVLDNATNYFVDDIYSKVVNESVKYLQSKEVYTYNSETLSKKAMEMGLFNIAWNTEINLLCERFDEIEEENQLEKEYRELRKASRGRVIGGGFGLSGALEGMAQAGMMNMASGMAHSVVNSIGNSKSDYKSKKSLNELYLNAKEPLASAVSNTVYAFKYVMMEVLKKEKNMDFYEPSSNASSKVEAIIDSLNSCDIEEGNKQDLIVQMLVYDPFNSDIYKYLVRNYGDSNGTIYEDSKLIGKDWAVNGAKQDLLDDFVNDCKVNSKEKLVDSLAGMMDLYKYLGGHTLDKSGYYVYVLVQSYVDKTPLNTIEDFRDCMDTVYHLNLPKVIMYVVQLYCQNIEVASVDILDRLMEILDVCKEYEVDCNAEIVGVIDRYVLKIDYNSIEIVSEAKEKLEKIKDIYSINLNNLINCLERVCELHRISKMYCNGFEYETETDVELARQERDRFVALTNNISSNDEDKLLEIKNVIDREFTMKNKNEYIGFIDDALKAFDVRYRCVCGKDYETRERADEVRHIISGFIQLIGEMDIENTESLSSDKNEILNANLDDDIKHDFLVLFDSGIKIADEITEVMKKNAYLNRYEQTLIRYEIEKINSEISTLQEVKKSNLSHKEYDKYVEKFISEFQCVFGVAQQETILASNKRYMKLVENARKYEENVLNKSTDKKSLFAKMKDGVKETFSKGYLNDYNMVTNNGAYQIPSLEMVLRDGTVFLFNTANLEQLERNIAQEIANIKEVFPKPNIDKYFKRDIVDVIISGENIIKPDKEINKKDIEDVMKEYKSSFRILDIDKIRRDLNAESKMLKMLFRTKDFNIYLKTDEGYGSVLKTAVAKCGHNMIDSAIKNDTILFIIEGQGKSYLFTENGLYVYNKSQQNSGANYYNPESLGKTYVDDRGWVVLRQSKECIMDIYGIDKDGKSAERISDLFNKIIGNMY